MKPNLFIVGAMKSGTTSAYDFLIGFPGVYGALRKEPHYFSEDLRKHPHALMLNTINAIKGAEYISKERSYNKLFSEIPAEARYVIDASTSYLYSERAAENIKKYSPEAKIVILLRDPVQRAWSEYLMNRAIGSEVMSFRRALESEHNQLRKDKVFLLKRYLRAGHYATQIERFLQNFPKENVFVSTVDHPDKPLQKVLEDLSHFLELKYYINRNIVHENRAKLSKYPLINSAIYFSGLKALASHFSPPWVRRQAQIHYYSASNSRIPEQQARWLASYFAPHNSRLTKMGIDIDHWSSP